MIPQGTHVPQEKFNDLEKQQEIENTVLKKYALHWANHVVRFHTAWKLVLQVGKEAWAAS